MRPLIQFRPTADLEARFAARAREWGVTSLGEAARRLAILADRGLTPNDHADVLKLSRALGGRGAGPFCDAADFISHRFFESLSTDDLERLEKATNYYETTLLGNQ